MSDSNYGTRMDSVISELTSLYHENKSNHKSIHKTNTKGIYHDTHGNLCIDGLKIIDIYNMSKESVFYVTSKYQILQNIKVYKSAIKEFPFSSFVTHNYRSNPTPDILNTIQQQNCGIIVHDSHSIKDALH